MQAVGSGPGQLLRRIHARVHAAMAEGLLPVAVEVGWAQYGELYRWQAAGADGARPRSVLDLPLVPVGVPGYLGVRFSLPLAERAP